MRIAFAANPLPGHIVPMIPLMRAALAAGHDVAVVTNGATRPFIEAEASPEVEVLAAGMPTLEAMGEMHRRTGASPATLPRPDVIAEYFGVRRVSDSVDAAVRAARTWQADVVVSESMDHVGPFVAAALDVPFFRHTYGPERPEALQTAMARALERSSRDRGVALPAVTAWIDAYPSFLEDPGPDRPGRRIPVRPEAHHRPTPDTGSAPGAAVDTAAPRHAGTGGRRRVLLTMGTVFTDQHLLDQVVASVEAADLAVDLVVTSVNGVRATSRPGSTVSVENVPFRPIAEVLGSVDAVVTVGGAGTVLGALTSGVPMVVVPRGADHEVNAARAEAVGAALVERDPDAVGAALQQLLLDDRFADSARTTAGRIASLPSAAEALARLEELATNRSDGAVSAV
jgi:UDP:flavonoid glycosyltransferase YjiC (YdhE family)